MYDVPFDQQIAGGDDALLRQVDDDVAGGVAAAEEQDADLAAPRKSVIVLFSVIVGGVGLTALVPSRWLR